MESAPFVAALDEVAKERDAALVEIARLRRRTHEIAAAKDAEHAEAISGLARIRASIEEAREHVRLWEVGWTTHPPSQLPGGWWRYASHNNAMDVTALLIERTEARGEAAFWRSRCEALGASLRVLEDALHGIADRETVELNPDGVDQAAWSMRLIARDALGHSK